MDPQIITKFTIATPEGLDTLLFLTHTITREKFGPLLSAKQIDHYLSKTFSEDALRAEMNSMSNQWLVVYTAGKPAGFARITSKGERPQSIAAERVVRIADLGVIQAFDDPAVPLSLLDKCLAVCRPYETIWINEYAADPSIGLFLSAGFIEQANGGDVTYELPLPSVCLIRQGS